ncbi:transglycosylase SLT domain-containing protein [Bacillus nitratireducens]|uniref:transglycosylase SLT domain-containing protein n=1 Tax=Bacillus nitratireducens TaxID=2026193 RepID=UPI0008FDF235|nr:transglycosylase SLT domain-containing protein [Bacillus nitratireducens]OJD49968.1 invasion protein [Bacillus nitratireducens]
MMKKALQYIFILLPLFTLSYVIYTNYEKQKEIKNNKQVISEVAKRYGIPEWIPLSIADHETKFERKAIGDKGTSFGLFQLHRDGLAPAQLSEESLMDPQINATIAISNMVKSYKCGVQKGLVDWELLKYVANTSGWPGNLGGEWTDNNTKYNIGLEQSYQLYK